MTERENILARVREALRIPAHRPEGAPGMTSKLAEADGRNPQRWLPPVGKTFEDQIALFRKNSADLRSDFHLLQNFDELTGSLGELRNAQGWKKVASHKGELTSSACRVLELPVCWTDQAYDARELETCDAGITECDAVIAQTGSVLVTSRSAGGRALSVLPPHHVVLARRSQMVADLPDAFALLKQKYGSNYPSFISFITGPSRTGDIERILVLGAHGPKRLTIFCL